MEIVWDDNWNIGHKEIDSQHQLWIGFFNKLDEALLSGNYEKLEGVREKTLKELSSYTDYHFKYEEMLIEENSYPEASRHWRLHKDFKNMLLEKVRDDESGLILLNTEIISIIRNWLICHIQIEDKKFGEFLKIQNGLKDLM